MHGAIERIFGWTHDAGERLQSREAARLSLVAGFDAPHSPAALVRLTRNLSRRRW